MERRRDGDSSWKGPAAFVDDRSSHLHRQIPTINSPGNHPVPSFLLCWAVLNDGGGGTGYLILGGVAASLPPPAQREPQSPAETDLVTVTSPAVTSGRDLAPRLTALRVLKLPRSKQNPEQHPRSYQFPQVVLDPGELVLGCLFTESLCFEMF